MINAGREGSVFVVTCPKDRDLSAPFYAWKTSPTEYDDEDCDYFAYPGELVIRLKCKFTVDEILVLHSIHGPVWMRLEFLQPVKK
jgi:hypothetical protein